MSKVRNKRIAVASSILLMGSGIIYAEDSQIIEMRKLNIEQIQNSQLIEVKEEINLGEQKDYNAIIRGDYNAKDADVEGSISVGGDLKIDGYHDVAGGGGTTGSDKNEHEGKPELIVGGNININGNFTVNGGIHANAVVSSDNNKDNLSNKDKNVNVEVEQSEVIKGHTENMAKESIKKVQNIMVNRKETAIKNLDTTEFIKDGSKKTVCTISDVKLEEVEGSDGKKYIVFTSTDKIINFEKNGSVWYKDKQINWANNNMDICKNLYWYFPNAEEVNIKNYVIAGSVIAKDAVINTNSGSVNGQLVAKELNQKGGFEVHNFIKDPVIDKIETGNIEEEENNPGDNENTGEEENNPGDNNNSEEEENNQVDNENIEEEENKPLDNENIEEEENNQVESENIEEEENNQVESENIEEEEKTPGYNDNIEKEENKQRYNNKNAVSIYISENPKTGDIGLLNVGIVGILGSVGLYLNNKKRK